MIIVKKSIKNLVLNCIISSLLISNLQAGWWDGDRITDKITDAIQASASTKTGGLLLAITTAYLAHRSVQKYQRHQAAKPIPNTETKLADSASVKNLFVHGLGGDCQQAYFYNRQFQASSVEEFNSFNFQDAPYTINEKPSCLGQDADINALKAEYDKLVADGHSVNLYGVSRGAATIIGFLARHQPKNVRCAVLESPFDDVESVVRNKLKTIGIGYIPVLGGMASAAITALAVNMPPVGIQNYSVYGINPRDCIKHISRDIPLLFIASEKDQLIPASSTTRLAAAIKKDRSDTATHEKGPLHCECLMTEHGEHANILNSKSGECLKPFIAKFIVNPHQRIDERLKKPQGSSNNLHVDSYKLDDITDSRT